MEKCSTCNIGFLKDSPVDPDIFAICDNCGAMFTQGPRIEAYCADPRPEDMGHQRVWILWPQHGPSEQEMRFAQRLFSELRGIPFNDLLSKARQAERMYVGVRGRALARQMKRTAEANGVQIVLEDIEADKSGGA